MMDRFGFIHDELDIKILILFVLRRLPGPVDSETLRQLCMSDGGVGYFDYAECLSELVENGNVRELEDEGYLITEKGARNAETVESSLPYSVRAKTQKLIAPVQEQLRRAALITAQHTIDENGCKVTLALSDGVGEILRLEFLCADEVQAKTVKKHFRRDAEGYYHKIVELLSQNPEEASK